MQTKRWLREEIVRLECRVEALENLLCPGGDHDWFEDERWRDTEDGAVIQTLRRLKCKRCGKIRIKGEVIE